MKRLYKRLIMLLLAAVMLVSLAACAGQDTPQPNGSESAQPSSDVVEPSQDALANLDGFQFILGDWWSAAEYEEAEPQTAWDQMVADYHHELEAKIEQLSGGKYKRV